MLAPHSSVVVFAAPERVEWHIAPGVSAMSTIGGYLAEKLQAYGQEQLIDAFTEGSPAPRR